MFVFLMKVQVTRKRVIFHELCLGKCWELMAKFHLLKIGMSIDIFSIKKC